MRSLKKRSITPFKQIFQPPILSFSAAWLLYFECQIFALCVADNKYTKRQISQACRALSGSKVISVYGNYQQGIFVLIIKNPTVLERCEKDFFPETSKSDKSSHGFGFSNMQYIVNKYDGSMHTLLENGVFTLSITLKLK